jgi:hypothetical protein
MKKEKIIKLKINDELYNYQALKGIFTYIVRGVRDYSDSVLYEIECQESKDHDNCRLLVSQLDNQKRFKYVSMINEDEEKEQYYWHSIDDFFISKNDCKKAAYQKAKEYKEKQIEELKAKLKSAQENLIEIKLLIDGCV